jgi:hypothetical protein
VADPRYYQVALPAPGVGTALAVARSLLARCAEPPIERTVEAVLATSTLQRLAPVLGSDAMVEVELDRAPHALDDLTGLLRDRAPRPSWFLQQFRSRFGSRVGMRSPYPYERDGMTWLSLAFEGPTGRERDEQPRVERWLEALAGVSLLPGAASPRRLAERFFEETYLPPGRNPPWPWPVPVHQDGVELPRPAYRADRASTPHYGPCEISAGLAVPPAAGFERGRGLWRGGGPVELHVFFGADAATAARWAAAGVREFRLSGVEADEAAVDALLDALEPSEPAAVRWSCRWPGSPDGLSGLVLYANATGAPDDELDPAPGHASLHVSVHPRVDDRNPDAFAARLADRAGARLFP